jgi:hypothetical protein
MFPSNAYALFDCTSPRPRGHGHPPAVRSLAHIDADQSTGQGSQVTQHQHARPVGGLVPNPSRSGSLNNTLLGTAAGPLLRER